MAVYELMVMTPLDGDVLNEEAITKLLEGLVKKVEGKITFVENMGERQLVYRIKGYDRGNYMVYRVEAQKNKIKELNKQLRLHKEILRYLLIHSEEKENK